MPHPVPPPVPPPQIHVLPTHSDGKHLDLTEVLTANATLELHPVLPVDDPLNAPDEAEAIGQAPQAATVARAETPRSASQPHLQPLPRAEDSRAQPIAGAVLSLSEPTVAEPTVAESAEAIATTKTRLSEQPAEALAVAPPETYPPEPATETPADDRPASRPTAVPLREVTALRGSAAVLGDRISATEPAPSPLADIPAGEPIPSSGFAARRRTSQPIDDQRVVLEGEVDLMPMLAELRQLSGATLIARTRGADDSPEHRSILTLPHAQAVPDFNPPRLEPTTGVEPEEEEQPAEPEEATPESPFFIRPDTGEAEEESPELDPANGQIIRPETGVTDDLEATPLDPPAEGVDEELPPGDRPSLDIEVTEDEILDEVEPSASPSIDADGVDVELGTPIPGDVLELDADAQDFDTLRGIFVAEGNVELRFRQAILTADRIRVNLNTRQAVADGNVVFRRGEQLLLGDRLDYNLTQATGNISGVRGEIFLPTSGTDLTVLPNDASISGRPEIPLTETLDPAAPLDDPLPSGSGFVLGVGNEDLGLTGGIRRLRFEADTAVFFPDGWQATNVRITNDPFSPPEVELRSRDVTYRRLSPLRAEIIARNPVLVFDQEFRLPLFQERIIIDNRRRNNNPLLEIGFDEDLGGLFLRRPFNIITTSRIRFTVSPLLLVQRALDDNGGNIFAPSSLGAQTRFDYELGPTTRFEARALFQSLEFETNEDLRANIQLIQLIGDHQLTAEYAYRNEFFNGSLGEREVLSSIGAVLTSPVYTLGDTDLRLSYQASLQYVTAETDRLDLIDEELIAQRIFRDEEGLLRTQASATLSRTFPIWRGIALPRTREEGLRFSPTPIVPFVSIVTSLRGTTSYYSNDETQSSLRGSIGLRGQVGQFSRDFLDYTGFNITFTEALVGGESPFLFDRDVDRTTLSFGILQQIIGPIRAGFQTTLNLDTGDEINTVYTLQYVRRTYSINVNFSPIREEGSLTLQINDFDWRQPRDPFAGDTGATTVEGGVILSE